MKSTITGAVLAIAVAASAALLPSQGMAQGQPFAPAVIVNGQGVTNWQIEQRARFLALLNAPNASLDGARDAMVNETLQVQAARGAGISLTPQELDAAMVEFAGRANLTPDQFLAAIEGRGVAPETFRDFVRNGLYWRQLVQQRFGPSARPTEAEIERTLARGGTSGVRVLLSEIAIPQTPENRDEARALAERLSNTITSQAGFQQAARQHSRAASRGRGGRIDWLPISALPPQLVAQVLALSPGEVSNPIDLGGFIGLYLLRDLDESGITQPDALSVDYAEYFIPGGRTAEALGRAAALRDRVDTCDDLYGVAKDQPENVLNREVRALGDIPADVRQELAKLDDDEVSFLLTRGSNLVFLMMCGRVVEPVEGAFEAVGQQLLNERLTSYAQGYLDELRADAIIEDQ